MISLHEKRDDLTTAVLDEKRAIDSLREELEAIDWYNQRREATDDPELKAILTHNMNEEKEHAAMLLEWLRRTDEEFDGQLRDYLCSDKPITELE